jgi:exopolysaccharide biosynthesis polyprenyl glycosylphosphotransferase
MERQRIMSGSPLPETGVAALTLDSPPRPVASSEQAGHDEHALAERRRRETIRRRHSTFRRSLAVADLLAVATTLVCGAVVFGDDALNPLGAAGALVLVIVVMKALGLYDRDEHLLHKTTLDEAPRLFEVVTVSSLLIWLGGDLIVDGDLGRRQVLGMWAMMLVLLVVGRSLARYLASHLTPAERCLLLGDADAAEAFRRKIAIGGTVRAQIVGWLPAEVSANGGEAPATLAIPAGLESALTEHDVHRIVLAPGRVDSDVLLHAVRDLRAFGVSVSLLPATPPVPGSTVEIDQIHGLTLLGVRSFEISRSSRLLKRGFDLAISSTMLVLLAPLLVAIALAIKLNSQGPVLFRQRRIGRHGTPFSMLKFRSMVDDAEERRADLLSLNEADGLFKLADDPRVTRVGRIIRAWSLDELPQLLNVLGGTMSLVGPRPLIPEEDSLIEGLYRRRLDLRPGMTGYWQAHGSSRIPRAEMVRLDYLYVANWSLGNDIRILLRTVPFVFGRRGL